LKNSGITIYILHCLQSLRGTQSGHMTHGSCSRATARSAAQPRLLSYSTSCC